MGMAKLLKSLWPTRIRSQLIVGVAVVHLTLMTLFVFDLVERQRDFLLDQDIQEQRSVVHILALNSSSWVLANDVVGLAELINSMQRYPDLRYAMVIDQDGKVLAHTDRSKVGLYVKDSTSLTLLKIKPEVTTLYSDHTLLDVAAPIFSSTEQCVGWARIGHGEQNIDESLSIISRNGVLYTLLAILVGSLFAVLIGSGLTSGLNRLLAVSDRIRNGQRDVRMDTGRDDEISEMGRGLNQMLDSMIANENEIQDLYNNAPCGYHSLDGDGIYVRINDTELKWLGYSRDEIIGKKKFSDLITPASAEIFRDKHPLFKEQGWIKDIEFEVVRRDGTIMPVLVSATAVMSADGAFVMSRSTLYDITERKRAEKAVRAVSAYNRTLIESSIDPLVTIGPDGKITDVNSSTEKVTGYDRQRLIGTDFSDYFTEPDRARAGYQQVFREGSVRDYGLEIKHRDGHVTPVLYNASLYRNEADDVIGVFAAARDITELKRMEEDLRRMNEELDIRVKERTAELERKIAEIEHLNKLFVGRELMMIELKKTIRELDKKAGPDSEE